MKKCDNRRGSKGDGGVTVPGGVQEKGRYGTEWYIEITGMG